MRQIVEVAWESLNKAGEELCGDFVETRQGEHATVVMSDGLGSGVKAHILSSLTAKMAACMLDGGLDLPDVIDAVARTLPVDEVRDLAYSTFTILRIGPDNSAHLIEYDNPPVFLGRGHDLVPLERVKREYSGKSVSESMFRLEDGDWLVMVSDGVLHAGIGGIWNLGWGWERVGDYLKRVAPREDDASSLARELAETTKKLYAGRPGDDVTVVAVKVRVPRQLTILAGPPVKKEEDAAVVRDFMASPGKKVVCGGTTSIMVARELGRDLGVNLASLNTSAPPTGRIDGIDLVTEGILTLTRAAEMLKEGRPDRQRFRYKSDGPSRLVEFLLEADEVRFIVGRAMNPAHQSPDLPVSLALKHKVAEDLARALEGMGKRVTLELR